MKGSILNDGHPPIKTGKYYEIKTNHYRRQLELVSLIKSQFIYSANQIKMFIQTETDQAIVPIQRMNSNDWKSVEKLMEIVCTFFFEFQKQRKKINRWIKTQLKYTETHWRRKKKLLYIWTDSVRNWSQCLKYVLIVYIKTNETLTEDSLWVYNTCENTNPGPYIQWIHSHNYNFIFMWQSKRAEHQSVVNNKCNTKYNTTNEQ